MARPISPPSASTSRTRCPFAVPPTAGLHGMCATVSFDSVHRPTLHPSRAAAYAASTPAWPAPMTMTSNLMAMRQFIIRGSRISFADAETLEDMTQHVFARAPADDLVETRPRVLQIDEQKFFRNILRVGCLSRGVE